MSHFFFCQNKIVHLGSKYQKEGLPTQGQRFSTFFRQYLKNFSYSVIIKKMNNEIKNKKGKSISYTPQKKVHKNKYTYNRIA